METVYDEKVLEFVAVANDYTQFIEQVGFEGRKTCIEKAGKLLSELYFRAIMLPELKPDFEDLNQRFVTEADYDQVRATLLRKFGEYDSFEEVFVRDRAEAQEYVSASISELMSDIWQDIKDFILLYEIGTNEVMYAALWELKQTFEQYWGQKLVNVLRAIHFLRYSAEDINEVENETNQDENSIFRTTDTKNWIISKRQEDLRDEEESQI